MDASALQTVLNGVIDSAATKSSVLVDMGKSLLSSLLFLMITWQGVKGIIEGSSFLEHLGSFIGLIFTWGIAMFFLLQYPFLMNNLNSGFEAIISAITGSNEGVYSGIKLFFDMASNIFGAIGKLVADLTWSETITKFPGILSALIFNTVTAAIILIAGLIYFIVYATSMVMFSIGVILGPVLIPWIIWEPTKDYFNTWLHYLVAAGMLKVVAAVLALLCGSAITSANQIVTEAIKPGSGILDGNAAAMVASLTAAAIAALVAWLMLQAQSITSALLPGRIGGSIWRPSMKMAGGNKAAAPAAALPSSGSSAKMAGSGQANAIDRAIRGGDKQGVVKSMSAQARAVAPKSKFTGV